MARGRGGDLHGDGHAALGRRGIDARPARGARHLKRRAGVAAALVLIGHAACAPRSAPPPASLPADAADLAVVTWNVHGEAGDVRRLAAALREGRLTGGRPPRAVVLLLQEASPATTVEGLHSFFAEARVVDGVPRGNAILSSLPLAGARVVELPRGRQRRVAAVASVRAAGADLLLVNVHLENRASWWRGALPGDRIRARQMDALLAELPSLPGILAGDLNIWLGTRERAYQAAAERFPDTVGPQHPTFRERLALDHVLVRLPAGWRAHVARAPSRFGSDHYPVLGLLRRHAP